jgi:hypothetical protein
MSRYGPCQRSDDAINNQTGTLLNLLDRVLCFRAEHTIDNKPPHWSPAQGALQYADSIAGRSG